MTLFNRDKLATALCAIALGAGCAEQRPPIDRVQPNAVDKELLDGEYYYQRTVVQVPAANGFTFVGSSDFSGLTRVTWDVQEHFLYARRSTELIRGADDRDRHEENGEPYRGEVIAAFAIEKHFDVMRRYNETTGEEINVVEENAVDRPWYERTYMRVDWSQNLVHNYELDFEAQSVEGVPYYVQEIDPITGERHPDAPFFEEDGSYFDVTNKIFAKAGTIELPPYGTIPVCWLWGEEFTECGTGEYTIRHSFKQVDPDHQYEPMRYDGKASEVFGFFTTDRMVYDDREGVREQRKERYLNRHNLWKRAWRMDGDQRVPIPFAEREIKPIVYYVNRDWPEGDADLDTAARSAADQWNGVYTDVVRSLGKDPGDQDVFVLCPHNPVREGDPSVCGEPGLSPRLGDIRYSFIAYVPDYMTYGLLGLGPSNNDPETGEIISGTAHVYHHNNLAAFNVQEMVELLNGDLPVDGFIDGVDLTSWSGSVNNQHKAPPRTFDLEEAGHFVHKMTHGHADHYWEAERRTPTAADEAAQRDRGVSAWLDPQLERMYRRGLHSGDSALASREAGLRSLAGTDIEEMLLNDEILMGIDHDPRLSMTEDVKDRASVVRGGFGSFLKQRRKLLEKVAAERTMYLPAMADDALMGLARDLKGRGLSGDEVYHEVRRLIYTAVITHELGHTLGLMHNFGGSDDAVNYFDEYWQIRDDGNVGPRLTDPITQREIDARIYDYAYTSIMDYAGRYTIDGAGVGKYDRAAMLFGYANKVEVFERTRGVPNSMFSEWYASDGDIINFWTIGPEAIHYTNFYNWMGEDLYAASNRSLVDASQLSVDWSQASDGRPRVPYIYCSHSRSDLGDSCLTRDFGADSYERMKNILDDLNTWYITRSFPRGRIGSNQWGYVGRWYGRIYNRLKQWHDMYGLYADFLPMYYSANQLEDFFNDPQSGWGSKTWAVQNAFNYLVQTILMPDVGSFYGPVVQPDGSMLAQKYGAQMGGFDVDVTNGRYYSTSWYDGNRECGYFWWECLHHVGFYLDKVMAIEALSDADTNFVARSTPEDIREWKVSYYNTFADQIAEINRAILAKDWTRVGPYWEGGQVKFPNYTGDLSEAHVTPVDPLATFTIQLYWQVLGLTRFSDNFNSRFVEESRIFYYGFERDTAVPDDRKVIFHDPISNVRLSAIRYDVEGAQRKGASQAMLERANFLVARSDYCDDGTRTEWTEDDCADPAQGTSRGQISAELIDYVQLLKVMTRIDEAIDLGDPYDP